MRTYKTVSQAERLRLIRQMPVPMSEADQIQISIIDVRVGGYIQIGNEVYYADEMNRYSETWDGRTTEWLRLTSLVSGKICYLEWEEDDSIEIYIYTELLKLQALGIGSRDLEEEEDFSYGAELFRYDDDNDATFYRDRSGNGERYYYWDYYNSNDSLCMGIERWDSNSYEAPLGHAVDDRNIRVPVKEG